MTGRKKQGLQHNRKRKQTKITYMNSSEVARILKSSCSSFASDSSKRKDKKKSDYNSTTNEKHFMRSLDSINQKMCLRKDFYAFKCHLWLDFFDHLLFDVDRFLWIKFEREILHFRELQRFCNDIKARRIKTVQTW